MIIWCGFNDYFEPIRIQQRPEMNVIVSLGLG